ncbi:thymidylate kinase [Thermoplasmatales archaeon]|nr:thymidylate kinase [Thermoplasmatales archaeon]
MSLLFAAGRLYDLNGVVYGLRGREDSAQIGIIKSESERYYVISDRYMLSALAYQSVLVGERSVDLDWMMELNILAKIFTPHIEEKSGYRLRILGPSI